MKRAGANHIFRTAVAGLALIAASACGEKDRSEKAEAGAEAGASGSAPPAKIAPNPSKSAPPSPAFAQFERLETGKFHSNQQFTVFNAAAFPGSVDSIQYNYVYSDGRFADIRSYDTHVTLQIVKFSSAERAKAFFDNAIAKSVPIAQAGSVRLPACSGQKRGSDDFVGPSKLVRTLPNPRGGEIAILQSGDFNMNDCRRSSNRSESAIWTEGEFYFLVVALPTPGNMENTGYGRAEEFAVDYTQALGTR
jgi:hypothetical protein